MFAVFVSVLQLFALVNAIVQSARAQLTSSTVAAVVRIGLAIAAGGGALWTRSVRYPGSEVPAPAVATWMTMIAAVLGPLVSFGVLWLVNRRMQAAPAAEEERIHRVFKAWLPAALLDALFVAINVFALAMSNPW